MTTYAVGCDGTKEKTMTTNTATIERSDSSAMGLAIAILAGVFLLMASGIAQATVFHDAAHDQRHAMAFPCH